MTGCRVI